MRVDIRIPEDYLPQINLRLNLYKRVSSIESLEEIDRIRVEMADRFGSLPSSVDNLLRYGVVKYLAQELRVQAVDRVGRKIVFKFFPSSDANLARMAQMLDHYEGSITPQGVMTLTLRVEGDAGILDEHSVIHLCCSTKLYATNRISMCSTELSDMHFLIYEIVDEVSLE